ncbi:sensor histidine kinase [Rhodocaloribacter sp.]
MNRSLVSSPLRLSISTRLTLWYGLTLLVLMSLFALYCYSNFHLSLHRDFDRHLEHETNEFLSYVRLEGERPALASLGNLHSVAYQTDGIYGTFIRLFSPEGDELYRSPNFQGHDPLPVSLPRMPREESKSIVWQEKPTRVRYVPLVAGDGVLKGWLEVAGFEWSLHQELYRLGRALFGGIILSVLLAIAGGYLLARRALRPVAALTGAAKEIRATDLGARLPEDFGVRDELSDLARTFNGMIERLEASFKRERRFSSNAAHELLTPLTTMRNSVEVALRRARDAETYQRTLRTVLMDAEEMSETVRGLLQLSQAERLAEMPREPVELCELSREHLRRFEDRAAEKAIRLEIFAEKECFVSADAVRMGEVLDNLLDNAIKYTPPGGSVCLEVEGDDREVRLRLTDTGVGFPPEQAGHLFDRFFRADTSEVQAERGSGLGLAIVQTIVHAYGGSITARSEGPHRGSTFEVRLPRLDGEAEA